METFQKVGNTIKGLVSGGMSFKCIVRNHKIKRLEIYDNSVYTAARSNSVLAQYRHGEWVKKPITESCKNAVTEILRGLKNEL